MASGINRLIATQQAPNLLGAVTGGMQARQNLAAGEQALSQAQQLQPGRNRLLGLQGDVQQAQLAQVQQKTETEEEIKAVNNALALTAGATDINDFNNRIMQSNLLSDEHKQIALELGPEGLKQLSGQLGAGKSEVQSSKILPGGLVQLVRKDGTVEILPANEAEAELVKASEARGAEIQGIRAQEREVGKGTAKIALESFDKIGKIRENTANLRQVIDLVGDGAETGPLADKLPSFRAETIKLNTLKNQLGLDVVGSVTFGALSEGELELALKTALPTNLDGLELVSWAKNKIDAQEKLASNLEEAAVFLSTTGNSVADWVKLKQQERKQSEQTVLPTGVTEDDIIETMRANNMTRDEVLQRLQSGR